MIPSGQALLLAEALPAFASDVESALHDAGRPELAAQVPELRVTLRCACKDDFCASFYTARRPVARWFRRGHQVELEALEGVVILDVVGGEIVYVEALFREDVRAALDRAFAVPHAVS